MLFISQKTDINGSFRYLCFSLGIISWKGSSFFSRRGFFFVSGGGGGGGGEVMGEEGGGLRIIHGVCGTPTFASPRLGEAL